MKAKDFDKKFDENKKDIVDDLDLWSGLKLRLRKSLNRDATSSTR